MFNLFCNLLLLFKALLQARLGAYMSDTDTSSKIEEDVIDLVDDESDDVQDVTDRRKRGRSRLVVKHVIAVHTLYFNFI